MDSNYKNLTQNLAHNLLEIRMLRNLTQEALAKLVNLPRSTIANLETGEGNPTLSNLYRISHALHIPIEKLITTNIINCKLVPAKEVETLKRSQGDVLIYKLLPESMPNMDIDRLEISPNSQMRGTPHPQGTREYFHCLSGEMSIRVKNDLYIVKEGDVFAFPGSVHHSYINSGKIKAVGISVVVLVPTNI